MHIKEKDERILRFLSLFIYFFPIFFTVLSKSFASKKKLNLRILVNAKES